MWYIFISIELSSLITDLKLYNLFHHIFRSYFTGEAINVFWKMASSSFESHLIASHPLSSNLCHIIVVYKPPGILKHHRWKQPYHYNSQKFEKSIDWQAFFWNLSDSQIYWIAQALSWVQPVIISILVHQPNLTNINKYKAYWLVFTLTKPCIWKFFFLTHWGSFTKSKGFFYLITIKPKSVLDGWLLLLLV